LLLKNVEVVPNNVNVRELCTLSINFELSLELPKNSLLIFRIRGGRNNKNDWYYFQPYNVNEKGYVDLKLEKNIKVLPLTITGKELLIKYLIIDSEGIEKDARINLTIRDTLAQSIIEQHKKIEIIVRKPGENPHLLEDSPTIHIKSEKFDHINVIVPSIVIVNEEFSCLLRFEDNHNNLNTQFSGQVKVYRTSKKENKKLIISKKIESNEGYIKIENLQIDRPGVYFLEAMYNDIFYQSNPVECRPNQEEIKLYWGYIHGHTKKSDGMRTLHDYFENLTKAGLDFGTSTEHDRLKETTDEDFDEIKEIIEKYNKEDDFTSLFGYEYGTWYTGYGDICIYHYNNNTPIFRSEKNKYNSTPKLIKNLKQYSEQVLMVGHHTALRPGYRNWKYFDNDLEKLVEIYSTWGNQEYSYSNGNPIPPRYKFFGYGKYARKRGAILGKKGCYVKDALEKGYKLGFVAGGDDHFGAFPSGSIDIDNGIYPSGIMAVWTSHLTRDKLWDALNNRKCYGTTGPRVILKFWLNQFFMGDIIPIDNNKELRKERLVKLNIISPIEIEKIELIRNNQLVLQKPIGDKILDFKYHDKTELDETFLNHSNKKEKFVFYYPRIFLEDRNMAWASPIWIIKNQKP